MQLTVCVINVHVQLRNKGQGVINDVATYQSMSQRIVYTCLLKGIMKSHTPFDIYSSNRGAMLCQYGSAQSTGKEHYEHA